MDDVLLMSGAVGSVEILLYRLYFGLLSCAFWNGGGCESCRDATGFGSGC